MKKVLRFFGNMASFVRRTEQAAEHTMKTIVTLTNGAKTKTFTANGHPSDVSDRIVKIKRALKIRMTHSTQSA